MRILKSHPLISLANNYVVDSPQPSNLSYAWNFGSLLAVCLIIQIITGVTLAMHYNASVLEAFNSVEHIMRDVNNGWLIRYLHSNTASAFFFIVYLHIGRGLYYGSYKAPRTLVWTIGTVIFILMMAKKKWPNWMLNIRSICNSNDDSLFGKSRTKALHRIGPHDKEILSIIICGMLGDWWSDKIKGQIMPSVRFNIEQGIKNSAYINSLTLQFNQLGYCSNIVPTLVKKYEKGNIEDRFNYRLSLFTFTSLVWIHDSFYKENNGKKIKIVPEYIQDYMTPIGLAHWIMQDGSRQNKQGISIATNSFTYKECVFLSNILKEKFDLKCTVVKTGTENQWRLSIWKESMPKLVATVKPYIIDEMKYKFIGYI